MHTYDIVIFKSIANFSMLGSKYFKQLPLNRKYLKEEILT